MFKTPLSKTLAKVNSFVEELKSGHAESLKETEAIIEQIEVLEEANDVLIDNRAQATKLISLLS